jgi:hypothetical protein
MLDSKDAYEYEIIHAYRIAHVRECEQCRHFQVDQKLFELKRNSNELLLLAVIVVCFGLITI